MNKIHRLLLLLFVIVVAGCASQSEETTPPVITQDSIKQVSAEDLEIVKGQVVYVPAYSTIFYADSDRTWDLAVTVSIRNTDADNAIIIQSVKFYDTQGNLITDYISEPLELAPLGSANIVLARNDTRGGIGANFIVDWAAESTAYEPVIESVMISTAGTQGLGFTSPGKVISDEDAAKASGQSVYVPVHSDIFFEDNSRTWDLAASLVIHNTDPSNAITITAAHYFDTDGNLVEEYIDEPVTLQPWAATGVLIERTDTSGGVGANFIVEWEAEQSVVTPIIEAIMVSTSGTQGLGFTGPGRVLEESP